MARNGYFGIQSRMSAYSHLGRTSRAGLVYVASLTVR